MVEHLLGEVGPVDVGLDSQISEHGVGSPSAKEHDGVLVDVGTEECGRSPRTEATGREWLEVYVKKGIEAASGVVAEVFGVAVEGFGGAKPRVVGSLLGYLFAADAVLLVSEC